MINHGAESMHILFSQVMHLYFSRGMELMEGNKIHHGQFRVLITLIRQDGMTQKELSEKLGVRASTMNVCIKRMEAGGYIVKKDDKRDRRVTRIFITDLGREVIEESKDLIEVLQEEAFGGFTEEEYCLFRRMMIQMKENLVRNRETKEKCFFMKNK
jgi:DNA-binding MarR family transcriptional regulator